MRRRHGKYTRTSNVQSAGVEMRRGTCEDPGGSVEGSGPAKVREWERVVGGATEIGHQLSHQPVDQESDGDRGPKTDQGRGLDGGRSPDRAGDRGGDPSGGRKTDQEDDRRSGPVSQEAPWGWNTSVPVLDVWAIEPYFGGSHRYFLKGLAANSSHRVHVFSLPGRHWKWRMHGGALNLARQVNEEAVAQGRGPDVLFVSDMLDLPVLLSLVEPSVRRAPVAVYFHENQLTYPLPPGVERDLGYGMKNLTSALAADAVFFNSRYHRAEFLHGVRDLLAAVPDEVPIWAFDDAARKARVLAVGCDLQRLDAFRKAGMQAAINGHWGDAEDGPLIVWNQRWEYDKAPNDLFTALHELKARGVGFRLAMAGPNQGTPTAEFLRAHEELGDRIVQWGKLESFHEYASLLWAADVVASTAIHECFGVAVAEAIYCGCRPVLPWRLSYPELIPEEVHQEVLYGEGQLVQALATALEAGRAWSVDWQRTWVARYDWSNMARLYDAELVQLALGLEGRGESSGAANER